MTLKTELLPYQIKAVEKLSKIKVGALYMEMGTGKTRTALELIARRYNAGKVNHILWLCPCSVKTTIKREIIKHADHIEHLTICGIETLSSSIRANVELRRLVQNKDVFLIVDESNLVKNHKAKRTQNIMWLAEECTYKLILNGTPISRNEADLFAQWMILDWRILGYRSYWSFANNHIQWDDKVRGKIKSMLNVDYIVRKIAPYSYQIKKEECLDLPRKTYGTVYYELDNKQMDHYHYCAHELLFEVDELEPHTIYRMFTGLQNVISGIAINLENKNFGRNMFFKDPLENPRIQTLLEVLDRLNEKVIIFCKYTHEIDDLVKVLNNKYGAGSSVKFNGDVSQKERQENIRKFEYSAQFFVANKMTAGYGLNLQFCNYVIYYSNDWDYATRVQSEDRVHRLGQNKNVHIIDIVAENTLDERILSCLFRKEHLVDAFKGWLEELKDKKSLKAMRDWLDEKDASA
ncbi:DEAD/DEAH box helicase [Heyndrickxia sporothermodurans]